MTTAALESVASGALASLVTLAIRALVLASVAGLGLVLMHPRRPSVRLASWTIVLYAALAMPMASGVMPSVRWSMPITLPEFSAPARTTPTRPYVASTTAVPRARGASTISAPVVSIAAQPIHQPPPLRPSTQAMPSWPVIVMAVYLAGAFFLVIRMAIGWFVTRRLRRAARVVDNPATVARLVRARDVVGMTRTPRLLEVDSFIVPIAMSMVRPAILLPVTWRDWDASTLDAVLIHELAHIRRRDVLTQRLSLIYRAVFWFSPLAWWLRRTLVSLAEDASDDAVLEAGTDRETYAEMLLGFVTAMQAGPRRARWHAVAMARGGAERRVDRILAWERGSWWRLTPWFVGAIVVLLAPIALLASSVRPVGRVSTLPMVPSPAMFRLPRLPVPPDVGPRPVVIKGLTLSVAAQTTPPPSSGRSSEGPVVRTTVEVRDATGESIVDLSLRDFRVYEDGVEQKIAGFDVEMGPRLFGQKPVSPPPAAPGRLIIVLIDDLNTPSADLPGLKRTLENIRDVVIRDDDLVGIVSTGFSSIASDPQYDRGHIRLNQAITKVMDASQGTGRPTGPDPVAEARHNADVMLATARDVISEAAKVNGRRKALIFVSPGVTLGSGPAGADFISKVAELIAAANRANVMFVSMSPAGMKPSESVAAFLQRDYIESTTETLRALAASTKPSARYLISYTSTNHDRSKPTRRVTVQVSRPGVQLDYLQEYTIK